MFIIYYLLLLLQFIFNYVHFPPQVAAYALPLYSLLPTITEAAVEAGYSKAYARIDDVGVPAYVAFFVVYMACVEFGVYWMHRNLHEIKWAYK